VVERQLKESDKTASSIKGYTGREEEYEKKDQGGQTSTSGLSEKECIISANRERSNKGECTRQRLSNSLRGAKKNKGNNRRERNRRNHQDTIGVGKKEDCQRKEDFP